jgi:hypothetical protein
MLAWNMGWYLIMSWIGQQIFGPIGVWIGVWFAILYCFKAITRPVPSVQLKVQHFANAYRPRPSHGPKGSTFSQKTTPGNATDVIDVEYKHIDAESDRLGSNQGS